MRRAWASNNFGDRVKEARRRTMQFVALTLVLIVCTGAAADTEYRLGPGDLISVIVYDEADLSLENVRVPTNGILSFPLLGNVKATNLTAHELEAKVAATLRQGYLKKPKVTVNILEYRPFFINGEVRKPGAYSYVDGLTVRKAITLAGGATERASFKKIELIHDETEANEQAAVDLDTRLKPGDMLTIGESLF